ncbi:nitrilase-related carbon-nitrogen hydrolase [Desulfosarcina ovata]|uniref:Apolipoprotein N-acyltransferase n=1 Tax=Desulfosarcina ovata subsp. ovata TaxID=2752305 RepID=A0A5K8AFR8_9BACT|nr:nitrilase-related carbon-nitrogen hydrolase [Desulfosarcina ovata]BBO91543.1 apolipoprotein N-acyltransferase [Desulfosarcina ovata subsp. ovata]
MKVCICQTDPVLLDVKANLEDTIDKIAVAKEQGADLVVFPELSLTGYFVRERYHEAALRMDSLEIQRLAKATEGTAAVVGFIEESKAMNFYNSALVAVDGEIMFAYRKLNLPNYGVFEERKIYSGGKHILVFRHKGMTIAPFICNDMWHPSLPYLGITQKADVFVTMFNSSRGSMGNEFSNIESWNIINRFYSRVFGVYNLCANRVGCEVFEDLRSEDDKPEYQDPNGTDPNGDDPDEPAPIAVNDSPYRFWGGSEIINPFGHRIVTGSLYNPDVIYAEISRELVRRKRILLPYLRNDDPYFTHRELGRILFDKDPEG